MPHPEYGRPYDPVVLPPELVEYLKEQETACLPVSTDRGTAFVLKLAGTDIDRLRGILPILLRHDLYPHPAAPVLRHVFTFLDDPDTPLTAASFVNIDEPEQLGIALGLIDQDAIPLFFYDEALAHTLTKVMPYANQDDWAYLLESAQQLWTAIPRDRYDFDTARQAMEALLKQSEG